MRRIAIGVRVDGHGTNTHFTHGARDPHGDLAPVRDEVFADVQAFNYTALLGPRIFSCRDYRERAALAVTGFGSSAGGASGSLRVSPRALRSSLLTCWRMSGLSLRNCLAFSRPWPIRSPL